MPLSARVVTVSSAGSLLLLGAYWAVGAVASSPGRRLTRRVVVSRVPTGRPQVALTFDDGPDPEWTPRVVEALEGAPATFFVLGDRARRFPGAVADLVAAGHEVACHGDLHSRLTRVGPWGTVKDLRSAHAAVRRTAGVPPAFFRPPHGLLNLAACWECWRLSMRPALWSTSSGDWRPEATADEVTDRVLSEVRPGSVVLLHDAGGRPGRPRTTVEALPGILAGLRERALEPVTLSTLWAAAR